ncbi:MAG: VanZ family protein [Bacilli bacterium]|nr:VanZ family protein [Bacilli bacterium]
MDKVKIAKFIKEKRKKKGLTQEELANKLFVTEKAISRWETAHGTPDISLLIPLSKELDVSVSEILSGEKSKNEDGISDIIKYEEMRKHSKYNIPFKLSLICYFISILIFLIYLKLDFNTEINVNYIIRLLFVVISSVFIIIGNHIYSCNYVEKVVDKEKVRKLSLAIIFVYYSILIFNMAIFARTSIINNYNLIPFKSIIEILNHSSSYAIMINIFGNMFVFMPIEYFLIELFKIKKIKINFIISLIIVLLFELIQLIFRIGVFDVDDIILCLFGMMAFYFIYIKAFDSNKKTIK